jgi:hypothetical protein
MAADLGSRELRTKRQCVGQVSSSRLVGLVLDGALGKALGTILPVAGSARMSQLPLHNRQYNPVLAAPAWPDATLTLARHLFKELS